jgi:hypothetical protein
VSPLDRRTLLKGSLAAAALTALPLQLPAAPIKDGAIALRGYRRLRRLQRTSTPLAVAINKLLEPARRQGGYVRVSVTRSRRRVSWLATAHAQVALEPIVVTAPMILDPGVGSLFGSIGSNQQFFQILQFQIAQQRAQQAALAAQQAALVNVMVVPPPDPEPTIVPPVVEPEPEPAPPPSLNDPLFNNPYSQYVASSIESIGLELTEALAVAFFIEGAATVLEFALPPVYATASQMIAEGLAAGTITARLALFGTGLTVSLTGVGLVAASIAVVVITLGYIVPAIERARRANISDFTGSVSVDAAAPEPEPVTSEPEAELVPYIPEGAPTSREQSEQDYPGYNWYWDIQNQAWVYFGE